MGRRVLIAEDDTDIQEMLARALEGAGYQASICDSGRAVEQTIADFKPDLLLLDVMLPGMDGHTLAKRLSENPATASLPIIVVSGLEPSLSMFGKFPQVQAYLHKPFDMRELLETVAKALNGR